MRRATIILTAVLVLTVSVGCAFKRGADGLSSDSTDVHAGMVLLAEQLNAKLGGSDPLTRQAMELADKSGKLKERCGRIEQAWTMANSQMTEMIFSGIDLSGINIRGKIGDVGISAGPNGLGIDTKYGSATFGGTGNPDPNSPDGPR